MIHGQKFSHNPFTEKQQEAVRRTSFAIVGLGGTGGFILENLLRAGAERLIVYDKDRFDYSNFNRQILATEDTLDVPKAEAAVKRAKSINPSAKVEVHGLFGPDSDLEGVKALIDGSDNVLTKVAIAKAARKKRIPYVFCGANSSRGIVTVFNRYSFEKAFQIDEGRGYAACSTIMCPAASLAGALAASQAINFIIRKPYVRAPEALFFDLFRKEMFWRAKLG